MRLKSTSCRVSGIRSAPAPPSCSTTASASSSRNSGFPSALATMTGVIVSSGSEVWSIERTMLAPSAPDNG